MDEVCVVKAAESRDPALPSASSFSIVMPAYNEEATLGLAAQRCLQVLASCTDDYELVIVDDASQDGTARVVGDLVGRHPDRVRAIRHERNQRIAATYEELYRTAVKDYVMLIPADDQYPPEALHEIIPLLEGHDIVVCKRTHKAYTPWRHLVSASYVWLPGLLFGVRLYDPGSTKCIRREVFAEIPVTSKGVFVEAERLIRAARRGYRIGAVDVVQRVRQGGLARGAQFGSVAGAVRDLVSLWVSLVILRRAG